jgi:hypothetical protein
MLKSSTNNKLTYLIIQLEEFPKPKVFLKTAKLYFCNKSCWGKLLQKYARHMSKTAYQYIFVT